MYRTGSAPCCKQDGNAVLQQARPGSPLANITSASDFIWTARREQVDAVFNSTSGRLPVSARLQPLAGMRGQPGSQLVSAQAPPGPLSVIFSGKLLQLADGNCCDAGLFPCDSKGL